MKLIIIHTYINYHVSIIPNTVYRGLQIIILSLTSISKPTWELQRKHEFSIQQISRLERHPTNLTMSHSTSRKHQVKASKMR